VLAAVAAGILGMDGRMIDKPIEAPALRIVRDAPPT
jgi:citrate lyase beta subunit